MTPKRNCYLAGVAGLLFGFVVGTGNGATFARKECIDVMRELSQAIAQAAEGVP